ncbi:MAG: hypothetical protein GY757_45875 [bacterium]|nr:hypothetical protein [bacterium]
MKIRKTIISILLALSTPLIPQLPQKNITDELIFPRLSGPYLGQKPPGMKPEIFAPGIISTRLDEYGISFSPGGDEFFFTRTFVNPKKHTIMYCQRKNDTWTKPQKVPFSMKGSQAEANFSPDGKTLFFGVLRPVKEGPPVPEIWQITRTVSQWGKPELLFPGMFATCAKNGTLYYTDISGGIKKGDIVKTRPVNGRYSQPEQPGGNVNSPYQDAHPFIAPNGDYLLFDSDRPGGFGNNDLYVCFRKEDNNWGEALNLGGTINSKGYDAIPYVSPDRKYLFFFKEGDIYWLDAKALEGLRKDWQR